MKRLLCWILSLCLLLCLVPGAAAAERVTGTLERRAGYDLASVRCELADGSYFFASVEETAAGYAYAFDCPAGTYTVKPEYFSTTVWDGAVDISWYDASQTAFSIDTPAKLAGLAALVNGQVDTGTHLNELLSSYTSHIFSIHLHIGPTHRYNFYGRILLRLHFGPQPNKQNH